MGPTLRSTPLSPACGPRRALDAWRPDAGSDKLLRALRVGFGFARRSRRRRFRRGPGSIARTSPYLPAVPRPCRRPGPQAAFTLPGGLVKSSAPGRQSGLSDFAPLWLQRSGIWLAPGRTFELFRVSSLHHAASRRRVEAVPKSLLVRRLFSLCFRRANPRLDVWKVRGAADSGKRGTAQLSTFCLNASGQRWITQRLVAKCADYPLSRCASSLSRRALSLMKPCASC